MVRIATSVQARTRRTLALSALVGVLLLGCAAMGIGPTGTPTPDPQIAGLLAGLRARQEYRLNYPGADVLVPEIQGQLPISSDYLAPSLLRVFGIPRPLAARATPVAIYAWYGQQLASLGWAKLATSVNDPYVTEQAWTHGNYRLFVGVVASVTIDTRYPQIDQGVYTLVFESTLVLIRPKSSIPTAVPH